MSTCSGGRHASGIRRRKGGNRYARSRGLEAYAEHFPVDLLTTVPFLRMFVQLLGLGSVAEWIQDVEVVVLVTHVTCKENVDGVPNKKGCGGEPLHRV